MSTALPTLKALQALESEAGALIHKAGKAAQLQHELAAIRTGEKPLMVAYKDLGHWRDEVKSAIEGIVNELGADLLRIAEMRLEAHARRLRVEAGLKRAQLATVVSPEPAAA